MFSDHVLNKYISANRQHALDTFPDRILVTRPSAAEFSINQQGVYVPGSPANITWQGEAIIPCRFDNSRSFRPDALRAQEVVANEHILHVPVGVDVRPDDKIILLTPVEISQNASFEDGLTGWAGALSGASNQILVLGGAKTTFADTTTELLGQTVGTGLSGEYITVDLWAEISQGTIQLNTPAGTLLLAEGQNGKFTVTDIHAGVENDIFLVASVQPATAIVAKFQAHVYKQNRVFEARKFTNASVYDISDEILVTEMEFQHSDD